MNTARATRGRQVGIAYSSLRQTVRETRYNPNYGRPASWRAEVHRGYSSRKRDCEALGLKFSVHTGNSPARAPLRRHAVGARRPQEALESAMCDISRRRINGWPHRVHIRPMALAALSG